MEILPFIKASFQIEKVKTLRKDDKVFGIFPSDLHSRDYVYTGEVLSKLSEGILIERSDGIEGYYPNGGWLVKKIKKYYGANHRRCQLYKVNDGYIALANWCKNTIRWVVNEFLDYCWYIC